MSCKNNICNETVLESQIREAKYLKGVDENGCPVYVDPSTIGNDEICALLSKITVLPTLATVTSPLLGKDCKIYNLPPNIIFQAVDTSTIDFTTSGVDEHILTGVVKFSVNSGNQTSDQNGVFTPKAAGLTVTDTNSVDLTSNKFICELFNLVIGLWNEIKHLEFYLTFPKFEYLYFKYPTFSKPETVSN